MKYARIKFHAALLSAFLVTLLLTGCDKQSPIGQLAQQTKSSAEKAKDAVKDAATKTTDAVKSTTQKEVDAGRNGYQKAVDAGKDGYQKAATFGTNAVRKTSSLATNVAAHARAGAQKVETVTTNIVSEIKQKFN